MVRSLTPGWSRSSYSSSQTILRLYPRTDVTASPPKICLDYPRCFPHTSQRESDLNLGKFLELLGFDITGDSADNQIEILSRSDGQIVPTNLLLIIGWILVLYHTCMASYRRAPSPSNLRLLTLASGFVPWRKKLKRSSVQQRSQKL